MPGGWVDEATWPEAATLAVDAMERLYHAVSGRLVAIMGEEPK